MMMWYGTGMGGWGYGLMTVGMVIFWVIVIGGIVAAVRYSNGFQQRGPAVPRGSTPQQTLANRYARGEIDDDEYTRRMKLLGTGPSA
ncbi:SHOCT domain-containing protein [Nocardia tengchongensis]